jgi:hypothetical protein
VYNSCQTTNPDPIYALKDGYILTLSCIFPLIANIILWALGLAGTVALFMIIFAGFQMIFSGGDAKAVDGARKTLSFAILGLFLIFLSFFILNLIATFTGVGCLNFSHGIPTSFTACR